MAAQTVWKSIFKHLKSEGFNVYSPATKKGEAKEKYIVLKDEGSATHPSFSTDVCYYSVLVYVPKEAYSELEGYKMDVKKSMVKLFPMVKPTGYESPSYFDEGASAHMSDIQYSNYKRKLKTGF